MIRLLLDRSPMSSLRLRKSEQSLRSVASPHGLVHQCRLGLGQKLFGRLAIYGFAANLQHRRHGKWGNAIERLVDDMPLDAAQHGAEPADVEEPDGRFLT